MTDEEKLEALGFYFKRGGKDMIEGWFRGDEMITMDSKGFHYIHAFEDPMNGSGLTLKAMIESAKKSLKSIYRKEMNNLKALENRIDSTEGQ